MPAVFSMTDDQQERQISMILHEAAVGSMTNNSKNLQRFPSHQPPPLTKKEINEIKRHNLNIRGQVYKAVRRPGKGIILLIDIFSFSSIFIDW